MAQTLIYWFLYLPKLQMRIAIRMLEKHGGFAFFLCGGVFIAIVMAIAAPIALTLEYLAAPNGITGVVTLPIFIFFFAGWLQIAIPWFKIMNIILERLNIGLAFNHVPTSRLEKARAWSNSL